MGLVVVVVCMRGTGWVGAVLDKARDSRGQGMSASVPEWVRVKWYLICQVAHTHRALRTRSRVCILHARMALFETVLQHLSVLHIHR